MSVARPELADIEAIIAKGEWWSRLFDELADVGMERAEALSTTGPKPLHRVVDAAVRICRAVRLAVVAGMRLGQILAGLADLRARSTADIAAARAHAMARANQDAAAREQAEERAEARREAGDGRESETPERESGDTPRSKPEPRDRDPLVEALDKRLAAVDPAIVDFDDLQLRETVLRICADLGVTPDWSRWEAGDWKTPDAPAATAAVAPVHKRPPRSPPPPAASTRVPPRLPGLSGSTPPAADTILPHVFLSRSHALRLRRPRLR
jgi:hypothetical protein